MTLHQAEFDRKTIMHTMHNTQSLTAVMDLAGAASEELVADADEPPDELLQITPRPKEHHAFGKAAPASLRKPSLLTQALHSSDSDHQVDDDASMMPLSRGTSTASLWSNNSAGSPAELTSDGGFTSPGTRNCSPSPPLPPATFRGLPAIFNKVGFGPAVKIHTDEEHVGPTEKLMVTGTSENAVEAGLGRKRCISFACGRKDTAPTTQPAVSPPKVQDTQLPQVKRPCTIRFACPSKVSTEPSTRLVKNQTQRHPSPAPRLLKPADSARSSVRSHRGSDSTVRTQSPHAVRKVPVIPVIPAPRPRRDSDDSDFGRTEARRFHEFASSEEEEDEWVQESTCHRSRLTVSDTLKIENNLRRLGEEVEEEAIEEEAELDEDEEDDENEDDLDAEDEDDAGPKRVNIFEDDSSDDGFKTDDEEGFAGSDNDSDAGSDFAWWAPRRSDGSPSMITSSDHIRSAIRRSFSDSSVGSFEGTTSIPHGTGSSPVIKRRRSKALNIRPKSPELPDSTDFVCGTLDEDRPLEVAYMSALEARRQAKHRFTPQDIDPSFPTSDPEMDEEDEDEEEKLAVISESDQQMMVGSIEVTDNELRGRLRRGGNTSDMGAKRLRSPPPKRGGLHRSPPPTRRLLDSPPKHAQRAPARRLKSPPPTRRTSFGRSPKFHDSDYFSMAVRPETTVAFSLPRTPSCSMPPVVFEEDEETSREQIPSRGAIEIKAGLERKRQRRQEKLYLKHCRKEAQREKDKRFRPGTGCKKMREIGLESIQKRPREVPFPPTKEAMILSI